MDVIGKGFTVSLLILDTDILDKSNGYRMCRDTYDVFQNWDQYLHEYRCDEKLKTKTEESTRLADTGTGWSWRSDFFFNLFFLFFFEEIRKKIFFFGSWKDLGTHFSTQVGSISAGTHRQCSNRNLAHRCYPRTDSITARQW
jgi:hypothetical protein